MKCIVGLGNPGKTYERTRHNAGFMVLERLIDRVGVRPKRASTFSYALFEMEKSEIVLLKPSTFMNKSGFALKACMDRFDGLAPREMLVVVDDVHLPLGQIRMRVEGSSGGHHGLESIAEQLGTFDFPRLRIGVGREGLSGTDLTDYVLGAFEPSEEAVLKEMLGRAEKACLDWAEKGSQFVMNRYN